MPKQRIDSKYVGHIHNEDGEVPEPFIHVGWDKLAAHVELATQVGGDYDEPREVRPGIFAQLDRNGINLLIRTLRKARDQAYGADA